MRRTTIITALAALALPVAAAAQQQGASTDAGARIEASMQAAARAEIPTALLESKVKEGRAKGISEARIASALEARLDALVRARNALAGAGVEGIAEGDLAVAADAIQVGVQESALVEVATSAPPERRAVATAVLASLVQLGATSDQALTRVEGALGAGARALTDLHAEVAAQLRAGGHVPLLDASVAGGLVGGIGNR